MKKFKKYFTPMIALACLLISFAGNAISVFAAEGDPEPEPTFWDYVVQNWWLIALVVLVIVFFVFNMFRRKKQVQEGQSMLESVKPGAFVMTQGGVIGKVVEVIVISPTEKHVVLETGGDIKSYITYDIRAVGVILKPEQLVPRAPAEEIVMPSDEEVQRLIDNVHAPAAGDIFSEDNKEETADETAAGPGSGEITEEAAGETEITPEGRSVPKKPAARKKAGPGKENGDS